MERPSNSRTIVFDLDGTLIDTAPDLIVGVNFVLRQACGQDIADDVLRPAISFGGREMIRRGLSAHGMTCDEMELDGYFAAFVEYYRENMAVRSRPFPGLIEQLDHHGRIGSILAVCTNKLEDLTWPLLRALDLDWRFAAIAGRDTFPVQKPDPRHLLATVARAGGRATNAVMIGDSNTDVKTAKAAGIPVIGVTFGYTDVPISELGCDAVISHYDQLEDALASL